MLGIWGYNLVTDRRHIVATIRSRDLCQCGCRGHCSLFPTMWTVQWSLQALASGLRPEKKHDGTDWAPDEPLKQIADSRGRSLNFTACLLFLKGDWAEWSHSLGLPAATSKFHPCPFCDCDKSNLHERYSSLSCAEFPFLEKGIGEYEHECAQREEVRVIASEDDRRLLLRNMEYLRGSPKARGCTLVNDLPCLDLRKGDRLEPSQALLDVDHLRRAELPITCTLWRATYAGAVCLDPVIRRCPLFSPAIGTSPVASLAVDTMHTVYFGPAMRFASAVLWRVLLGNPWGIRGTQAAILDLGCRRLHSDLRLWCEQTGVPHEKRLNELTLGMLGSLEGCSVTGHKRHPGSVLKTKAAETGLLVPFAMHLLSMYGGVVDCKASLQEAGAALCEWLDIVRAEDRIVLPSAQQQLIEEAQRHLLYSAKAGITHTPKHHLFAHITHRPPMFICTPTSTNEKSDPYAATFM